MQQYRCDLYYSFHDFITVDVSQCFAADNSESCDDLRVEETRKVQKIILSERELQLEERKRIEEQEVRVFAAVCIVESALTGDVGRPETNRGQDGATVGRRPSQEGGARAPGPRDGGQAQRGDEDHPRPAGAALQAVQVRGRGEQARRGQGATGRVEAAQARRGGASGAPPPERDRRTFLLLTA